MLWARVTVPADLRASLGKTAWRRSTGTKNFEEARIKAGPWIAEWKGQIEAARGRPTLSSLAAAAGALAQAEKALERWKRNGLLSIATVPPVAAPVPLEKLFPGYSSLSNFAKGHAAWRFFAAHPQLNRDVAPTPANESHRAQLEAATKSSDGWSLVPDFMARMEEAIGDALVGVPLDHIPILRKWFAEAWLAVEIAREQRRQHLAVEAHRLLNYPGHLAVAQTGAGPRSSQSSQRLSLSELEERFLRRFPGEARLSMPTYLRRFREAVGDVHVDEVTATMVDDFLVSLRRYPVVKNQKWAHLTFTEILERFEDDEEVERISGKTVRVRWAYGLKRFFNYAVELDLIAKSPVTPGLLPKKRDDGSSMVDPYSPDEIDHLFSRPMFHGFTNDRTGAGYRDQPGDEMIWDGRFWMPILALWHGFRAAEIGGCALHDIKKLSGHWVFDLRERDLKNDQSRRIVPLHPKLTELGFLDYVSDQRDRGETWLFPEFDHDRGKDVAKQYGKWFGLWRRRERGADGMRNFHSFRHTFINRCRELELPIEHRNQITGHAKTIPESYGGGLHVSYLAAFMAKVSFPTFPSIRPYAPGWGLPVKAPEE